MRESVSLLSHMLKRYGGRQARQHFLELMACMTSMKATRWYMALTGSNNVFIKRDGELDVHSLLHGMIQAMVREV
jgi:hypothetical protein